MAFAPPSVVGSFLLVLPCSLTCLVPCSLLLFFSLLLQETDFVDDGDATKFVRLTWARISFEASSVRAQERKGVVVFLTATRNVTSSLSSSSSQI